MRPLLYLIPAVLLGLFTTLFMQTPAYADPYRWCAQYNGGEGDGGRNCGFVTIDQCRAAISGIGGICEPNQFYTGPDRFYAGPNPYDRRAPKHRRNYRHDRD
jgi:Protein of unknown function (DUF3551)